MRYIRIDARKPDRESLKTIIASLRSGQIVILPTDTIYGFSCLSSNAKAIHRLAKIKERPLDTNSPFLSLATSWVQVKRYLKLTAPKQLVWKSLINKYSAVTAILPSRGILPKILENRQGGLALRLPESKLLRTIIRALDEPLVSTSCNISGEAPFMDMKSAQVFFSLRKLKPDLIVDTGRPKKNKSSVLVDLSEDTPKILRF